MLVHYFMRDGVLPKLVDGLRDLCRRVRVTALSVQLVLEHGLREILLRQSDVKK